MISSVTNLYRKMAPGRKGYFALEDNKAICYAVCAPSGISVTAITDKEYPERSAYNALYELVMDFEKEFGDKPVVTGATKDIALPYKTIGTLLKKWQNPKQCMTFYLINVGDKLYMIEIELRELEEIMRKNLEEILKKDEKLDELMKKSKDLKGVSYNMYKTAKKNNQCCSLY